MAYRGRMYRKPHVRTITVKYAGQCACCSGVINVGSIAEYYPIGTVAGVSKPMIAHIGGVNGTSNACFAVLKGKQADKSLNDFAGDGLDARYEDSCKEECGL